MSSFEMTLEPREEGVGLFKSCGGGGGGGVLK